jgi:hypothetical protein
MVITPCRSRRPPQSHPTNCPCLAKMLELRVLSAINQAWLILFGLVLVMLELR